MKLDIKSFLIGVLSIVCIVLLTGAKDSQSHTHDAYDIYGVAEEDHDHDAYDIYGVAKRNHDHDGDYADPYHSHY